MGYSSQLLEDKAIFFHESGHWMIGVIKDGQLLARHHRVSDDDDEVAHNCPDLHEEWYITSDIGWIENRYASVSCAYAYLTNEVSLEKHLTRETEKLDLVRFFDNSTESRELTNTWNLLTERWDEFGFYDARFSIRQMDCSDPKNHSPRCTFSSRLPSIQVIHKSISIARIMLSKLRCLKMLNF